MSRIQRAQPRCLLAILRARTSALHRDVERSTGLRNLLIGELRLARYLEILERFWRYHVTLEAALDTSLAPGFRLRPNVRLLERDLRGIELRAPQRVRRATPVASLGILYVLEGSALGGVTIGRRLMALPELTGRTAFFGRARREVNERWRTFCAMLEAVDDVADDFVEEAVGGAERAFESARTTLGDAVGMSAWKNP